MFMRSFVFTLSALLALASTPVALQGQVTLADYERAFALRDQLEPLVLDLPGQPSWIGQSNHFWYWKTVAGGREFVLVDVERLERGPAFDQEALAGAINSASGRPIHPLDLPLSGLSFAGDLATIEFTAFGREWACDLAAYRCEDVGHTAARPAVNPVGIYHRGPAPAARSQEVRPSPDGRWEAFIKNYNVYARPTDGGEEIALSWDGGVGDFYTFESLAWSPDSRKLAAYRLKPGERRILRYIESAPADQLQPEYSTLDYTKPGDLVDQKHPALFLLETREHIKIDNALFRNQFEASDLRWREDGRAFTFEHNERGHEVYRVIEVDASTGQARAVIEETSETFFFYQGRYRGKYFRHDINDGEEVVWMSERDGWNHLYLYDGVTGRVKNQITRGGWVVREVDHVDEAARQIWFRASGMNPEQDPYFVHYYRINFDGSGLTEITRENADHSLVYSPDMSFYVNTRSRVDLPPRMTLHRTWDQAFLLELEVTDISRLEEAGWRAPESFVAKGRDGSTDIWGVIVRPIDFDPGMRYPVIESIYAGPQNASVPKTFSVYRDIQSLAELGFIVVQIDGMGTNNRSKAFQDVAYKRLHDAGFPDRILWHRAVADRYPYYDLSRVGIYGGSAGGYSATAGILHHPDFYQVAVAANGNHDHRMDKISFNELFMGWPLGPQYAAASNVDNAWRLEGRLLLVVGEMDHNVDPASTFQVVDALIRAHRTFDLLVIPGGGHAAGGSYGLRLRYDYFVQHLLGHQPPNWNRIDLETYPALNRNFANRFAREMRDRDR